MSNEIVTFCSGVCPWAVRQAKQMSTWRGIVIGIGVIVSAVNPALAIGAAKVVGGIVAAIDVIKDDSK